MRAGDRHEGKRRGPGRRWPKGVSGNPGGRPKVLEEVRSLARQYTIDAVNALVSALKRPGERVAAAKVLLAYGYGSPVQAVEVAAPADRPISSGPTPEDDELVREMLSWRLDALAYRTSRDGNGNGAARP